MQQLVGSKRCIEVSDASIAPPSAKQQHDDLTVCNRARRQYGCSVEQRGEGSTGGFTRRSGGQVVACSLTVDLHHQGCVVYGSCFQQKRTYLVVTFVPFPDGIEQNPQLLPRLSLQRREGVDYRQRPLPIQKVRAVLPLPDIPHICADLPGRPKALPESSVLLDELDIFGCEYSPSTCEQGEFRSALALGHGFAHSRAYVPPLREEQILMLAGAHRKQGLCKTPRQRPEPCRRDPLTLQAGECELGGCGQECGGC